MPKYTYRTARKSGSAIALSSMRSGDTVRGVVIREGGDGPVMVDSTDSYWADRAPRNLNAMTGKLRKRYADYYERTGECWHDKCQREKLQKSVECVRTNAARRAKREHAEAMHAALAAIVAGGNRDNAATVLDDVQKAIKTAADEAERKARDDRKKRHDYNVREARALLAAQDS